MIKGLKNKHKDLVGQTIRKTHLAQWDEQHFLEFFAMIHHFCPRGEWMWNDLSIKTFCQQAVDRPLWEEWMWRYEMQKEQKPKAVANKIMGLLPVLGTYIQGNPHLISPRMREVMKGNAKLERYTEPFKVIQNEIGADIVVPNTEDGNMFTLPEVQYHKALLKMSSLANALVESIKVEDLKKMSPEERIKVALSIINMMNRVQGGQKPNIAIFKQLIVNNAGREELEKAMLAYNND